MTHHGRYSSLCRPDDQKSCFGCCPPIRPAGYDHMNHRRNLARRLSDNTRRLARAVPRENIITGFSCWGLGYLDRGRKLIGCLLHPGQNNGRDLRDLTGYGDKCRQELCREAVVFSSLTQQSAAFVLELTLGLDSFEYSSHRANPAFRLLRWGPKVIDHLSAAEPGGLDRASYDRRWPVPTSDLAPERDGFAVETLLDRIPLARIASPEFLADYQSVMDSFIRRHKTPAAPPIDNRPFVHQLDIPAPFARFMRSALNRPRAAPSEAARLLAELTNALKNLE